jgi:DNA-binding response OmpR family regulator
MDKTRILIVDDDIGLSRLVGLALEKTRLYEVKVENRSRQALRCARSFDLISCCSTSTCQGWMAAPVAGAAPLRSSLDDLHIIFFTSLISQKESGQNLIQRGDDLFLPKPIDTASLVRSIETVLAQVPARS